MVSSRGGVVGSTGAGGARAEASAGAGEIGAGRHPGRSWHAGRTEGGALRPGAGLLGIETGAGDRHGPDGRGGRGPEVLQRGRWRIEPGLFVDAGDRLLDG